MSKSNLTAKQFAARATALRTEREASARRAAEEVVRIEAERLATIEREAEEARLETERIEAEEARLEVVRIAKEAALEEAIRLEQERKLRVQAEVTEAFRIEQIALAEAAEAQKARADRSVVLSDRARVAYRHGVAALRADEARANRKAQFVAANGGFATVGKVNDLASRWGTTVRVRPAPVAEQIAAK